MEERLTIAATPEPVARGAGGGEAVGAGVAGGAGGTTPVNLDATVYRPEWATADAPVPAVVLAHGFGGTKNSVSAQARSVAEAGYVVLAYTARGFGRSGGLIHLDHPDFEVADASLVLDVLARRPEVTKDGAGDPRVAVAGASYGGALALMLAGTDPRVDAVVASITWHDLRQGLVPQHAVAVGATASPPTSPAGLDAVQTPGVFKRLWAGVFFGGSGGSGGSTCGRFAADLCAAYSDVARTGVATPQVMDRLRQSSPVDQLGGVRAPVLILQGLQDSLFPLSEADANAAAIAAAGAPVSVVWFDGGHDTPAIGVPGAQGATLRAEAERVDALTQGWFDRYVRQERDAVVPGRFEVTVPDAVVSSADSDPAPQVRRFDGLPGITGPDLGEPLRLRLTGSAQTMVSPPGGTPAAVSTLPGLGGLLGLLPTSAPTAPAGQAASFETAALKREVRISGSPRVRLRVESSGSDATVFASIQVVSADGRVRWPQRLVAPVRLTDLPRSGVEVTIALPAVVVDVPAGSRLRVVVTSTDQAFALPVDGRTYRVALAGAALGSEGEPALLVPQYPSSAAAPGSQPTLAALLVVGVAVGLLGVSAAVLFGRARRRRVASAAPQRSDLAGVALAVEGLSKQFRSGLRAVDDLTFRVGQGQVLALLGPNGAGKTTTLRMALGLVRPSSGEVFVFGRRVVPGAAVLGRVGAFVEGPGLLPHLTGLDNLRLYWASTGRPEEEAHLDVALEVAGLGSPDDPGSDVRRRVRTYSQGMRQRLAIAQAMLGLPDLLVLDEPTNGLDPPQIREMRDVVRRYAASGRTVVISSHLLAEVEQTCTHVVVMQSGRLVASGRVGDVVGEQDAVLIEVDDPEHASRVAADLLGADRVRRTASGVVARLDRTSRGALVRALVDAGLSVEKVTGQRGLEEAFLALVGDAGGVAASGDITGGDSAAGRDA